ncbi:MAG TPA: tetratricopeptide repeat protein [Gemmatimonadales bacterium]|nr:tetratricopeptide repeat protein [Gemmatimonadales bacterium]
MTTPVGAAQAGQRSDQRLEALLEWAKRNRGTAITIAVIAVLGGLLFAWSILSRSQQEAAAGTGLGQGRFAWESKNYALAASELSRVRENYSGTRAAQEATIMLAQVRLAQGQPQQAIEVLSKFAGEANRDYQAQAYGLLGAAYENISRPKDAAETYQKAASAARFPFLAAQYLSDAGRAWLAAGDTAQSKAAYEAIVAKYDSTGTVVEARVRLGEITKGSAGAGK